ncbi:hypothetical protein KY285_028542 [Solanum tuberosum]|nr:hypothetical protein KY284_028489 [Solanum tuberosum]KAH0667336.1 hypothetical protein KY285_028542 [Solanum tuberosum]
MEFSELATMPQALMYCLFDSDEDDKFASLKCVGLGNLVYVYNEEHLKNYPACVCEFSNDFGMCSWRKLPNLPPNAKFEVSRASSLVVGWMRIFIIFNQKFVGLTTLEISPTSKMYGGNR